MCYVEGWGSGFLRVNEELAEYGAKPVAIEDAGVATRLNVTRGSSQTAENTSAGDEDNEDNREDNEDNLFVRVCPSVSVYSFLSVAYPTYEMSRELLKVA